MLINVFGVWINPNKISYLCETEVPHENEYGRRCMVKLTEINFDIQTEASKTPRLYISNKTPDEVGSEINRLVMEQRND